MKRYDSYKDSGVEWIGEIPSHWRKSKTNFLSSNYDGKRVPLNGTQRSEMEGEIPYWGSNGVVDYINKSMFNEELVLVGEDGSPFFDIYKPISFKVTGDVWINNHIHVLKHKESEVLSDFLVHSFNITDFKEFITGSTRDKLTQSDLSRIPHFLPPLTEQQQIVSFLDTKTSHLDSLIEKTQRKIELLKEKRTSLINEVVTKGLNPNVEMKDSGVEWIGEIPSHWDFLKLWLIIQSSELGGNYNGSTENDGIPMMKMGNIDRGKITLKKVEFVEEPFEDSHLLKKGDFLFNTRNSIDLVGKVCIWRNELEKSIYNSNILRIIFKKDIDVEFMNYLFNSKSILDVLRLISKGTTSVSGIYYKDLSKIKIPIPSISEQQQIVEYLDEQTHLIDNTISIEEKRIELLKEYRQSLISEVVTGKQKVV